MDSDPGSPRAGLRTSLEAVGAVGGGLLVLGTLAGLLGVTGWLAVALVILGGLGVAVAVGRWTSSRLQSLAGASLALVGVVGIAGLAATGDDPPGPAPGGEGAPAAVPSTPVRPSRASPDADGEPLKVAVEASADKCGTGWIVPVGARELGSVPGWAADPTPWAEGLGGETAEEIVVRLTVDTATEAKVTLHDIRVEPVKETVARSGTHVAYFCGDPKGYRFMSVDLDPTPPKVEYILDDTFVDSLPPAERQPIRFPYVVSSTDPESFEIHARTRRHRVEFVVEIEWSHQGRTGVVRVDDGGRPFTVRASATAAETCVWLPENAPGDGSSSDCPVAGG